MQNNKFPKIQVRLSLALALLIIIVCINSMIYILDVRNMNKLTQDIINHPYSVSNSVRDIEININAIHRTMKDVALVKNEIQLNHAIEDVNNYEKLIYSKFDVLEEKFLGDLKTVSSAKQSFKNWKPIRDEVIELVKTNKKEEAAEITKGKGAIHVNLLFTKTHEMIEFADNKANEFNENSLKIMNNAKNKSLFLLLATLIIGVIIFFWLFNSISKPLNRLINRVIIANKKQLGHKLPLHTNNKLLILDFAISELENRDKILEEEINMRTKELNKARNLIENAIDNASIGMTMINFDGLLLDVNHAFCKFIGYSREELLKMKFNDFTHEADKKRSQEFIKRIIDGGNKNEVLEKRYIHKSGEIIHGSVTSSIVRDSHNKPIYLFAQIKDISEQKNNELELIEYKKELENMIHGRTKELEDKTNKLIKSQKALTYLLEDVNESQRKMKILNEKFVSANKELERMNKLFVGREVKMVELKEMIRKLESE